MVRKFRFIQMMTAPVPEILPYPSGIYLFVGDPLSFPINYNSSTKPTLCKIYKKFSPQTGVTWDSSKFVTVGTTDSCTCNATTGACTGKISGGGKNTLQGEGAGCADFANTLFKVTTNYDLPPSWIVRRKISTSLIGGKEKKINFLKLLFRENWVKDQEDYLIYETADTNQAFDWIEARVGAREEYHYQEVMMKKELLKLEGAPIELSYQYEMNQSPGDIWGSIKY